MFLLNDRALRRLVELHRYVLPPEARMILFGLRGCLPVDVSDFQFRAEHGIEPKRTDHKSLRCTIGQWDIAARQVSVYAGSTIPNWNYVVASNAGLERANQMLECFIEFEKGRHRHYSAFIFTRNKPYPVQRVRNDRGAISYDFDADDDVEVRPVDDDLHAASIDTTESANGHFFSSAGCQVVIGHPPAAPNLVGGSPSWERFRNQGYGSGQTIFPYLLTTGSAMSEVVAAAAGTIPCCLRFGSRGPLVEAVQRALKQRLPAAANLQANGQYEGDTLQAVRAFQRTLAPKHVADGCVDAITAAALGLGGNWPKG